MTGFVLAAARRAAEGELAIERETPVPPTWFADPTPQEHGPWTPRCAPHHVLADQDTGARQTP